MGAAGSGMEAGEQLSAATLLSPLRSIAAADRSKHEAVLDYWLSIRGNRELPPLRDLDPLQISDAGPGSILLELIGGGEDAEVRYLGNPLDTNGDVQRIGQAPKPSILASIAKKLSIVAISRDFLAFEDTFSSGGETTRVWVTLLPLSSAGAWVDYVYGFVTFDRNAAEIDEPEADEVLELSPADEPQAQAPDPAPAEAPQPEPQVSDVAEAVAEEPDEAPAAVHKPSFSFDAAAAAGGFYATGPVRVEPRLPPVSATQEQPEPTPAPAANEADEIVASTAPEASPQPSSNSEGPLQTRLTEVRAKADEARLAKLRANAALYEGLSAAYDFALDAEDSPEEYLRLVQDQGVKIQLRSPMRPVARLAFDGLCDEHTLAQLEAVLAWAFEQDLPRGGLAERLEAAGGVGAILAQKSKAA